MVPIPVGSWSLGVVRVQLAVLSSWPWGCHSIQYVRPEAWAGQLIVVPLVLTLIFRALGSGRRQGSTSGQLPESTHRKALVAPLHLLAQLYPVGPGLFPYTEGCRVGSGHRGDQWVV